MDLIPTPGSYRNLESFQVAQVVYDLTVRFWDRYIASLEKAFVEEGGGLTERMYRLRSAGRNEPRRNRS